MNFFKKTPTAEDHMKEQQKILRKCARGVEKDRRQLEKQEHDLIMDMRRAVEAGNSKLLSKLGRNLVRVRKQKGITVTATSRINYIESQTKAMAASAKLASTMATTSKTMGAINKEMNPQGIMKTMQDFEKESTKMAMAEEIVDDTLDSVLTESGDEEEEDAVVNQILDEIGIEISGKMAKAPSAHKGALGESSKANLPTDDDLEKQLAQLRT